ncbi:MAG TPA: zinc metalloprotease HtpX [Acidimicrobiia bacterium]
MYEDIAQNKRRTWLLIGIFAVVVFGIAWLITFLLSFGIAGVVIAAVIAIVSSAVSYYNSDKVALAMSHAKPAPEQDYKRLHNLVEGLCIGAGIPKPRLYVIDDEAPNAFSTGRNPQHSAVAVTSGLLEKMNRVELEGVLAHELSHIRNYDILVSTLAVTMVGMVALMSDLFLRFTFWGGMSDRNDSNDSNPLGIVLVVFGFIAIIFAPLIAQLMQLAVSRQREYLADASGVQITRYPPGLVSALEKLKGDQTHVHFASKATAHMWIEEPLDVHQDRKRKFDELFMTHPPLDDRIARLEEM